MADQAEWKTLGFMQSYKLSPFTVDNGVITIPHKYHDLLSEFDSETDFEHLPATEENWKHLRELLVSANWLDCWYQDGLPTIKTEFHDLGTAATFADDKFIRLNSVSSKTQLEPVRSLEIVDGMMNDERCMASMRLAKRVDRKINVAVRDWIDVSKGIEWRCFIYDDKLRAISINDTAVSDDEDEDVIDRVEQLFKKIRYNIPCVDCVMDVWLSDEDPSKDLVIEFNSYGFWGNAGTDLFDWVEDGALLYGLAEDVSVRR